MKRLKLYLVLIIIVLSLFFVCGIHALFVSIPAQKINTFSVQNNYSYKVVHKQMDLNGTTYTTVSETTGYAAPGSTVTPEVLSYTGFTSPQAQTVTINSNNQTITYLYTRNQYLLTITDSQFVTTTTPSGYYYYDSEIHLTADADNGNWSPFVKWSDDTNVRDYTFALTEDTTIGPIYSDAYNVTFVHNNNTQNTSTTVIENQSIGSFPNLTYESCSGGQTGSYHDRQCTYAYKLVGWYTEPEFINEVNEDYVPTSDCSLYAKWTKVYYGNAGPVVFDGTNYIDTDIKLFSEENADKDFVATFTVDENNGYAKTNGGDRGTIFTDMDERAEPYPGVQFFNTSTGNKYTMNVNVLGNKVKDANTGYTTGQSVVLKKEDGIVSYSYDNGSFVTINDLSSFDTYFDNNATFGAGTKKDGTIYRFFKGTLSDISLEVKDPASYTIHFDPNGGTGMMIDQNVRLSQSVNLTSNAFTNDDSLFGGWNTAPDGSGTSYVNREQVSGLGNKDDVVTLYAQWLSHVNYFVHFDANGGIGTMNDQRFTYNASPEALSPSAFEKNNHVFVGWNTAPDGSGTSYTDEQLVQNLSDINNDVVTLYAQYMRIAYEHDGPKTFDGTVNSFIDTGVNLYSSDTVNKDFEIHFTVTSVASNILDSTQPTLINSKDESNPKWPGFNVRFNNSATTMYPVYKWNNGSASTNGTGISTSNLPVEFVFKRTNRVVTLQYYYDGYYSGVLTLYDQRNWTLNQYFADNISFGGIYNSSHIPDRFFRGELDNMLILIAD